MAKMNPLAKQGNNLFNLKSFNSLKKDQTNIKIFKNSSFDSSFNSVQSLNINLSQLLLLSSPAQQQQQHPLFREGHPFIKGDPGKGGLSRKFKNIKRAPLCLSDNGVSPLLRLDNGVSLAHKGVSKGVSLAHKGVSKGVSKGEGKSPKISAILRAIRSIRLNRDEWKLIRYINLMEHKNFYIKQRELSYKKIFSYNNIISKNILLRNMKYNFLKSTLSSILKKKIRSISEVLEDKPIKNYVLYSYLKNCIFTPPFRFSDPKGPVTHLNVPPALAGNGSCGGRTKLSLNKYKGRKFGSFINYNKIIGYKFNSTFYQALPLSLTRLAQASRGGDLRHSLAHKGERFPLPLPALAGERGSPFYLGVAKAEGDLVKSRGNIYIKDIYKLLFYLFKSMYCLISKPVLKYTNDKVTIQLFYYLNIPKKKVFRLFSISYINSIKKKWLAQSHLRIASGWRRGDLKIEPLPLPALNGGGRGKFIYPSLGPNQNHDVATPLNFLGGGRVPLSGPRAGGTYLPRGNTKIYIRWKLRKAISRLNFKIKSSPFKAGAGGEGNFLLFKLRKFNLIAKGVYQKKFKLICAILSKKFNKPVELQLIRLHHPYHDSNILVNLLSLNIKNKRKKARVAIQKIYNKKPVKNLNDPNLKIPSSPFKAGEGLLTAESLTPSSFERREAGKLIPAFLSGLNIKIAGRLMGEPIIPRITNKVFGKGASATGKVNYLDVARITKKNRKGAYTIKITSGQNFF